MKTINVAEDFGVGNFVAYCLKCKLVVASGYYGQFGDMLNFDNATDMFGKCSHCGQEIDSEEIKEGWREFKMKSYRGQQEQNR